MAGLTEIHLSENYNKVIIEAFGTQQATVKKNIFLKLALTY